MVWARSSLTQFVLLAKTYLRSKEVMPTSPKPNSRALCLTASVISLPGTGSPVGSTLAEFLAAVTQGRFNVSCSLRRPRMAVTVSTHWR